jgi:hypothetical protein
VRSNTRGDPLDGGSIEDGILTCHWHHARFALTSGCTFDLWADDMQTCPVEIRAGGEVWVKPVFGYLDPVGQLEYPRRIYPIKRPANLRLQPLQLKRNRTELVSGNAKFPASCENTGNFRYSGLGGASEAAKKGTKSVPYVPIP